MPTKVSLIAVPYMAGQDADGPNHGPEQIIRATQGSPVELDIDVSDVERQEPFRDSACASLAVCRALTPLVAEAIRTGRLPIVLAGSCDVSKGILSAFDHSRCGVVWIDAHADFNTPETTRTGFFPGMSLAVLAGHCYREYWAQLGNNVAVPEDATMLLGVRDVDPWEQERLDRSALQIVAWRDGRPQGDVETALDVLAGRVREVYLHLDMDALDPSLAPGIVDDPVAGGMTLGDLDGVIRGIAERFRLRAVALTAFNPARDVGGTTLRSAVRVIELVSGAEDRS
jgi:arginase